MELPKVDEVRFWRKVKAVTGLVPFVDDLVATWYCATDPATPLRAKAILLGAIAYFVLPFDVLPDMLVGLGFTDDLAVLVAALRAVAPHVTDEHRARAKRRQHPG